MKAYIDLGDYPKAEECAERLFEIEDTDGGVDWNHDAILEMIYAYMDAGQKDHAANLVRKHYFNGQPVDYHGISAAEALIKGRQKYKGGLYLRVLDRYADWHDNLVD